MLLRLSLFIVILTIPACGASTAQLVKTWVVCVAALAGLWTLREHPGFVRGGGTVFWLVAGVLCLALFATMRTPFFLFDGLVGSKTRLEGWLLRAAVFAFGWSFWRGEGDAQEVFCRVIAGLILAVGAGRLVLGWDTIERTVGAKMGVAALMAACLPVVVGWAYRGLEQEREIWRTWLAVVASLAAVLMISESGTRSALLGALAGVVFVAAQRRESRFVYLCWAVTFFLTFAGMVLHPTMRTKVCDMTLGGIGDGARTELARQFWHHGLTVTGWGLEAQRHLVDRRPLDRLESLGVYDRLHAWPLDVASAVGVLGLLAVVVGLVIALKLSWTAPAWDWWQAGFGGSLLAFAVCSMWNPPALQGMLLATVVTAGVCTRTLPLSRASGWTACEIEHGRRRFQGSFRSGFGAVSLVGVLVYGSLLAGDVLNTMGVRRYLSACPHAVLARHWLASKLNPWTHRDFAVSYIRLHGDARFREPEGGKVILRMLQRDSEGIASLKGSIWLGMGEREIAAKWFAVATMEMEQKKKMAQ